MNEEFGINLRMRCHNYIDLSWFFSIPQMCDFFFSPLKFKAIESGVFRNYFTMNYYFVSGKYGKQTVFSFDPSFSRSPVFLEQPASPSHSHCCASWSGFKHLSHTRAKMACCYTVDWEFLFCGFCCAFNFTFLVKPEKKQFNVDYVIWYCKRAVIKVMGIFLRAFDALHVNSKCVISF